MDYTEACLPTLRNSRFRRLAACYFGFLAISFLGCALSFLVFRSSRSPLRWTVNGFGSGFPDHLRNALRGQALPSLYAALLALSAFTMFCIPAAVLLCLLRGASLGCFGALAYSGRISVLSGSVQSGAAAYLLADLVFCFLAALTAVYSDAFHRVCRNRTGEGRYSTLIPEFFRSYSVLSGLFFLAGMTAQFLLT